MKTNKRGISLIVLVITIIVIIILAAAVILTLNNNNPINNSKQAAFDNDCSELKSAMSIYISTFMAKDAHHNGPFTLEDEEGQPITEITISSGATNAEEAETIDEETQTSESVSWEKLGLGSGPSTIATAKYNPVTGLFTITATNPEVTGKTDW